MLKLSSPDSESLIVRNSLSGLPLSGNNFKTKNNNYTLNFIKFN